MWDLKDAYAEQLIWEEMERLERFGYSEKMLREMFPYQFRDEKIMKRNNFVIEIDGSYTEVKTVRITHNGVLEEYKSNKPNRRIIGDILSGDANINKLIDSKIRKEDKKKYKVLDNSYNEKEIRLKVSGEIKDYVNFFNELGYKCGYDRHKYHSRFVIEKEV